MKAELNNLGENNAICTNWVLAIICDQIATVIGSISFDRSSLLNGTLHKTKITAHTFIHKSISIRRTKTSFSHQLKNKYIKQNPYIAWSSKRPMFIYNKKFKIAKY